jgi:hypothetical protein
MKEHSTGGASAVVACGQGAMAMTGGRGESTPWRNGWKGGWRKVQTSWRHRERGVKISSPPFNAILFAALGNLVLAGAHVLIPKSKYLPYERTYLWFHK